MPINSRESRAEACLLPPPDATFPAVDSRRIYMPGSTTITYLPLLVQRNRALWGPDADQFDPERWLQPDRLARYVVNPTIFTPFSAGPRIVSYMFLSAFRCTDHSGNKSSVSVKIMPITKFHTFLSDCCRDLRGSRWHPKSSLKAPCLHLSGRKGKADRRKKRYGLAQR